MIRTGKLFIQYLCTAAPGRIKDLKCFMTTLKTHFKADVWEVEENVSFFERNVFNKAVVGV